MLDQSLIHGFARRVTGQEAVDEASLEHPEHLMRAIAVETEVGCPVFSPRERFERPRHRFPVVDALPNGHRAAEEHDVLICLGRGGESRFDIVRGDAKTVRIGGIDDVAQEVIVGPHPLMGFHIRLGRVTSDLVRTKISSSDPSEELPLAREGRRRDAPRPP